MFGVGHEIVTVMLMGISFVKEILQMLSAALLEFVRTWMSGLHGLTAAQLVAMVHIPEVVDV